MGIINLLLKTGTAIVIIPVIPFLEIRSRFLDNHPFCIRCGSRKYTYKSKQIDIAARHFCKIHGCLDGQ